jgi:hypothetical protein
VVPGPAVEVREAPLEFAGLLPHLKPVEEEVGNFKPKFEPLRDFLLLATLFRTQPDVCRHAPRTLLARGNEFSRKTDTHAVRNFVLLPVERVNLLERAQCAIQVTKLK